MNLNFIKEIDFLNNHTKIFIIVMVVCIIYAIYYLYKNFKTINNQLKIIIILLIIGFVYGIYFNFQENISINALKTNYSLSKGKIKNYIVSNKVSLRGGSGTNDIEYTYFVDDRIIQNKYSERGYIDIPDSKPDLNIEYLVIYEKGNPLNSFILLNYPLKNGNDFDRYEELFKYEIPENVFERD